MKRKRWQDRKCSHGVPDFRMIFDFVCCSKPGCFNSHFADVGFKPMSKREIHERQQRKTYTLSGARS